MSDLTTQNFALVFALVILCFIPNIVHNVVSHYASYDVIINDIKYGLKLVILTYVLLLFALLFLFFCLCAFLYSQNVHLEWEKMQDALQFPSQFIKDTAFVLLGMLGFVTKVCIVRFILYKIITCQIFGRYGLYVKEGEQNTKIASVTLFAFNAIYLCFVGVAAAINAPNVDKYFFEPLIGFLLFLNIPVFIILPIQCLTHEIILHGWYLGVTRFLR